MKKNKENIIICVDWFYPAYKAGGPIQSVYNLVSHLKNDYEFWIFTSDTDLDGKLDLSFPKNQWKKNDGFNVIYIDSLPNLVINFRKLFMQNFIKGVYFNSMFSLKFFLLPFFISLGFDVKRTIAPRGMLGEKSLSYKTFKKKFFLNAVKFLKLHYKLHWHATDTYEQNRINHVFGCNIIIDKVGNLPKKNLNEYKPRIKKKNYLSLFTISRIAEIKNLDLTLNLLKKINKNLKINFKIIGPIDEKEYWSSCKKIIETLPKNIYVEYIGAIPNHEIINFIKDQHVMILPTQHENFGHVIMESWQTGCPVIISNNTPWKELYSKNIGYDINNNDINTYVNAISNFGKMNQTDYDKWSKSSYKFGKSFSENETLINKTKKIFL